ncbi:MAG: homoserine dehydrogenase [Oscillospiraceae bacterium]|jgi:homoserine dehydrogenase|nr:homoserine dehydrogenase [Oscillospiraceae bacterium]
MINIAIMGHGVVGTGVVEVIRKNRDSIERRAGERIRIKYILDLRDFPDLPYSDRFIKDFALIENDSDISIVVECMGGLDIAYDFVKRSLLSGKSVVTSNKELIAERGHELIAIAKAQNLNLLFEASVGGGIPIIRPLSQCMAANEVSEIAGILNGTTNYILTKMIRESYSFEEALQKAQAHGYAEADPTADVDGHDACRKICILASLAFGKHIYPREVHTEGIRDVTLQDVAYCSAWGGAIKLLGVAKKQEDGKLLINVAPYFIPIINQMSSIDDVFNGIMVRGDATGDVVFYGRGAGKLPTASAVVADVIDCVKHISARKYLYWEDAEENMVADYTGEQTAMYIRICGGDEEMLRNAVEEIYGACKRLAPKSGYPANEAAFVTPVTSVKNHNEAQEILSQQGFNVINRIRIFAD